MTIINYMAQDGSNHSVRLSDGESLMRGALRAGVPGMVAECGGDLTCGTCHVYISEDWLDRAGTRTGDEEELLDLMEDVRNVSRLACQITVRDDMEGLTVVVANNE
ncbi:2Fe-2S ferredoxin [Rhodococcoides fascians]|uniref:2Fe-2S iron-sulfur cluster-binding protein n=1 Tax=Rhodococcoides fascians TaxID=1828 RepID=UPI000B9BF036|nr:MULTISPECIES: 2Fe-2S iron-sulfur cluster-binding protein [Rhodococcus]OZD68979.1 2Fe-2S ferredoxin [Rhodococcus sp. 06-1059B-a]OZE81339.1 2Fe-2S ferredoxin [Rhodococcus fascians]OZF10163.1 2Fe-2S ferredoxin [Rhodococcus fascians]OZF13254.1 2Fe-2S ferredoxin [Rhodococcus fascians]OZF59351.1 2Fe-2S ferredoxin [Rhodococcus fascians]